MNVHFVVDPFEIFRQFFGAEDPFADLFGRGGGGGFGYVALRTLKSFSHDPVYFISDFPYKVDRVVWH